MEPDTNDQLKKRRRIERGRSKNGCLTCLTKKVKCDEERPRCARCVRLGLGCEWAAQQIPLASRRRGFGPIKKRSSWMPQAITPKVSNDEGDILPCIHTPAGQEPSAELIMSASMDADMSLFGHDEGIQGASSTQEYSDLPSEDANLITFSAFDHDTSLDTAQLILFPTPSFNLLSIFPPFSFTNPTEPAPSIGTSDVQAMTFHSTILAPMKSTRKAALSSHSIFLNFAVQNPMALHFLLAFSHSELAIHHGFSHRPPLESHLHFQHGSQLFSQALADLTPTDHIAMMLSFLYLYMFWMRRDPFDVSRLRELSNSILAYVTTFSLDEICANSTEDGGASEPVILSRILTYIYDRDVFCGFFACGEKFAGYVSEKHDTRQRIWKLSRMPILSEDQNEAWFRPEQLPGMSLKKTIDVYFNLITIQYEINQYSQSRDAGLSGKGLEIKRRLDRIRQEHSFLLTIATNATAQSAKPPLMALVTSTIFYALQIYLHRSRDSAFGQMPLPQDIDTALKELVIAAYHAIATGPVQLLERFQWALMIAGIETQDPVHRDWISANISDPVIKSVFSLVLAAKGRSDKGVSMEEIRDLVSRRPQGIAHGIA
ncbi:zn 2cys6 transcription factor [Fusarium longipes]|uniref:Zn 2cys6 transcription factor n=1 Tax=Fusarium longipes TaxID=694270 RepID=A0A395T6G4_9HYPO|nr:zn 2cys6 transcription factor [Fusarium longipes]